MRNFVMTSESVTEGHPDKLCDQISDAVIDAYLAHGVRAGVIAECAIATGVTFLSVRAGAEAPVDLAALTRRVMTEAGYGEAGHVPTVMLELSHEPTLVERQVAQGRARQMVTAFGYACAGTERAMPAPVLAAHGITRALDVARREGRLPWLSPDAQAQVAMRFEDRRAVELTAIAITAGVTEPVDEAELRDALMAEAVLPALTEGLVPGDPRKARFVVFSAGGEAGPAAHSGLTGRKSADDAYGSYIRRSGPALSGKDPSRVDRIATYAARQAARTVVAAGLARECELQLSYVIGDEGPVTVEVDSYGSGKIADAAISARVAEVFDLRVGAIAERMGLWGLPAARNGRFYRDIARYGHMGRDELSPPWEDVSMALRLG